MDRVLFALSVPKCVCCKKRLDYGQRAICPECSLGFDDLVTRNCSRCAKRLYECDCSNDFLRAHFVKRVIKCFRYIDRGTQNPGNSLIYSLKQDNRGDVLDVASDMLSEAIRNSIKDAESYIFTNIPRRRDAIVEHGIDHSELLAKEVARKLGADYMRLLKSNSRKPQKSLERDERMKNADFSLIKEPDLTGKCIIVVDDVITTGASVSVAASLIRSLGARNITAACLAIAYKDS